MNLNASPVMICGLDYDSCILISIDLDQPRRSMTLSFANNSLARLIFLRVSFRLCLWCVVCSLIRSRRTTPSRVETPFCPLPYQIPQSKQSLHLPLLVVLMSIFVLSNAIYLATCRLGDRDNNVCAATASCLLPVMSYLVEQTPNSLHHVLHCL